MDSKQFLIDKAKEMMAAPSCCAEAKEAAQKWIDAVGTDGEKEAAKALIAELEEDVCTIDDLIGLCGSERGAQIFGAEGAANMLKTATEAKAKGTLYCLCPACTAGGVLLGHKELIL